MHQCLFVIIPVSLRRRDQEYYGKNGQWTTVQCSFLFIKETNTNKICRSRAWDTAKDYCTDVSGVVKWDWFPQSSWSSLSFLSFPRWFYWWARLVDAISCGMCCHVVMFQTFSDHPSEHFWCILSLKICIDRMSHPRSKSQLARRDYKRNKNVIKCNGILQIHHSALQLEKGWKWLQEPPQPQEPTGQAGRTKSIMTDLTLGPTNLLGN